MKTNKLAAGALALVLGLGALAPSFAAEEDKADEAKVSETPAKEEKTKEQILKEAEDAYDDARVIVKAVEIIKDQRNIYDNNKEAIDAYLAKATTIINDLGKVLGKKVAVSDLLFSTAYAEEASLEEIQNLTNKAKGITEEGKGLIKEINDKIGQDPTQNTDPKQDPDPAPKQDPDPSPKQDPDPSPKQDPDPASKQDPDPASKQDPKDKNEGKTPAAKKSQTNAKTGVAGVTGVAGILAAASVAYAASKKRD